MTQHTIRRRCVAFLAIGAMAALAMPSTAQAAPQLADLGVKQSMSVKASNGESLEGKDLRAIQLATYTAASVDGNTIVGYDLTTNTALAPDITAAAKTAGATDANLTVNGKNDPMAWVVKDLNGLTPQEFLEALKKNFVVEEKGTDIYKPAALHNFSLYLDGKWYSLTAKPGTYDDHDPIGVLDVTISSNLILDEILGIKDLRSDKRIDFVGGIRGLGELKKRVDSGEMKMALALYPVSMKQLMDIADTGNIMPPKTTWFEPKLRSGLVIHKLE